MVGEWGFSKHDRSEKTSGLETKLNMTQEDAVALIAVSLEALIHRRHVGPDEALTYMPVEMLGQALSHLDECGADTAAVRAEFAEAGFDLSEIPQFEVATEQISLGPDEFTNEYSGSRVPSVIAEAILAKFREGWSKSRIAREFRLNRRTVIRICAAR